jgi:hypothetical protein
MATIRLVETNFTGGEVSPLLRGRSDLAAFDNGAAKLRNVVIHPTGGVSRRPGLRFVDDLPGTGRLIPFELAADRHYVLALSDRRAVVYLEGVVEASFATPWTEAQIAALRWAQGADMLLVTHPDVPPQRITRSEAAIWTSVDFAFAVENEIQHVPFHRYATDIKLRPTGTTGGMDIDASADWFTPDMLGSQLRLNGGQIKITDVRSGTNVRAEALIDLVSAGEDSDSWGNPLFQRFTVGLSP